MPEVAQVYAPEARCSSHSANVADGRSLMPECLHPTSWSWRTRTRCSRTAQPGSRSPAPGTGTAKQPGSADRRGRGSVAVAEVSMVDIHSAPPACSWQRRRPAGSPHPSQDARGAEALTPASASGSCEPVLGSAPYPPSPGPRTLPGARSRESRAILGSLSTAAARSR
jgi:hypothetical protein